MLGLRGRAPGGVCVLSERGEQEREWCEQGNGEVSWCWEYALEAIMYDVIPNVFIKLLSCPSLNI